MQTLYATHLPLPAAEDESGSSLDAAAGAVCDWLTDRFRVSLPSLDGGRITADGVQVEWGSLLGDRCGIIGFSVEHPNSNDPLWRWRTMIDLGVEDGSAWLRVRLALASSLEGMVTRPRVKAGRPGVVKRLAASLHPVIDGWDVSEWRPVAEASVPAFTSFLTDETRLLPVVAISQDASGRGFLDPSQLADTLLGVAHVVEIDPRAAYALSDSVGKALGCYKGAVRVYYPGFSPSDDPYFHRLYVGGSLAYLGADGLASELFDTFGRQAALSLGEPALRRRLLAEQRNRDVEARVAALAEVRERMATVEQAESGGVDAHTWAAFSMEYEQAQLQLGQMEEHVLELQLEVEQTREALDDAQRQTRELARGLALTQGAEAAPLGAEETSPTTVSEAVRIAEEEASHTVYLQEAHSSASESQFRDPLRVLQDLRLIEAVAREWAEDALPAGPDLAFKERCPAYRNGIGEAAGKEYAKDYTRTYGDELVMLGPHIRRGIGAVSAILRIYWYVDRAQKKIVVGHVGRKLRDTTNRN